MTRNRLESSRNITQTVDWHIIICYLSLVVIGLISIYAAGHSIEGDLPIYDLHSRSGKQLLWIGISLIVGAVILFAVNPHLWEVISTPAYILVLLMLAATIVLGKEINGSKSWFSLGAFSFQPCEISKITTSLLLAHCLRQQSFKSPRLSTIATVLIVLGLPSLLILAEKETGTVLVYLAYVFVLYREGLSGEWLALGALVIVLFITSIRFPIWVSFIILGAVVLGYYSFIRLQGGKRFRAKRKLGWLCALTALFGSACILLTDFVFNNVLQPHQRLRIEVLLGIKEDLMGAGYNVNQSLIAIGSGGAFGKGFLQGTQTTYGFVPEQSTDFIFCTIGEEFGFVGCALLIALFVYLIYRIVKTSEECRDPFNRIYGYCVACILFMHMIINIGMTIKLMPVIGIPLPFISYGGSSMLSFTTMLFIFLALVKQEKKYF